MTGRERSVSPPSTGSIPSRSMTAPMTAAMAAATTTMASIQARARRSTRRRRSLRLPPSRRVTSNQIRNRTNRDDASVATVLITASAASAVLFLTTPRSIRGRGRSAPVNMTSTASVTRRAVPPRPGSRRRGREGSVAVAGEGAPVGEVLMALDVMKRCLAPQHSHPLFRDESGEDPDTYQGLPLLTEHYRSCLEAPTSPRWPSLVWASIRQDHRRRVMVRFGRLVFHHGSSSHRPRLPRHLPRPHRGRRTRGLLVVEASRRCVHPRDDRSCRSPGHHRLHHPVRGDG